MEVLGFCKKIVGYQRAAEMTLTGRLVKSDEAINIGLLLEAVEPDMLMSRTLELARELGQKPPQALRYTKRLMRAAQRMELRDFLDMCAGMQGICHNTDDHMAAVTAFLEKRSPTYAGS